MFRNRFIFLVSLVLASLISTTTFAQITISQQAYIKASNADPGDWFGGTYGTAAAISGNTIVVGAERESGGSAGVNGNQSDNSLTEPGAAYVFVRNGATWSQQAYLKQSNPQQGSQFSRVAISGDTIAVGAQGESSNATGVNGNQSNTLSGASGAAYVFVRNGTNWTQQSYLKASNAHDHDYFGNAIAIDGDTIVVGAFCQVKNPFVFSGQGAAYVFVRNGTNWVEQAFLKASNVEANSADGFGFSVAISGNTIVVGANWEDSNATGVNGNQTNNLAPQTGAAYVFVRTGTNWAQQAYLKASNTHSVSTYYGTAFGFDVAISTNTIVVGSPYENSTGVGINGTQTNYLTNTFGTISTGAAYVFVRNGNTWSQQAFIKANFPTNSQGYPVGGSFGSKVSIVGDILAIGADFESSSSTGVNGDPFEVGAGSSGATYLYSRAGTNWTELAYIKASNTDSDDDFGAPALSDNTLVVSARWEDSNARGINGDQADNSAVNSGAVYVFSMLLPSVAPDIAVYDGTGNNERQSNTGSSVFNNTLVGGSITQTFTIKNAGTGSTNLSGLVLSKSGINAGDFTFSSLGTTSLAASATTSFTVIFTPSATGARSALLQIVSNDGDESPFVINLTGTGSIPVVLSASYTNGTEIPLVANSFVATGSTVNFALNYAPAVGAELMVVKSTGNNLINGTFTNLAQGQPVTLNYGGITYSFVADYYGGNGNDLVLAWANNRAYAWGKNEFGQLGDNSTTNRLLPVLVSTNSAISNKTLVSLSRGVQHTIARCSDGTLLSWGDNSYGQIGDNTAFQRIIPVAVNTSLGSSVLFGKKVVSVVAGAAHNLALCSDGTLAAWGDNFFGELGDNTTTQRNSPVSVDTSAISALNGKTVVAISASDHNLALCSDGTVVSWGVNYAGQLGINNSVQRNVPVAVNSALGVSALFGKTVVAISAGAGHSLALCSDGTVVAWGDNYAGQLGENTTTVRKVPVVVNAALGVSALFGKTVVAIAAGVGHSLALCSDGTVVSWGNNWAGQLGDNSTTPRQVPVAVNTISGVSALFGKTVVSVAAGADHSSALCSDGSLVAWGLGDSGRLGDNSTTNHIAPTAVKTNTLPSGSLFSKIPTGCPISEFSLALVGLPTGIQLPVLKAQLAAGALTFQWPTNYAGYAVQATTTPGSSNSWANVTVTPAVVGSNYSVTFPTTNTSRFFRLKTP